MREAIRPRLLDTLELSLPKLTLRSVQVPKIPNKAQAVIGMRRAGKTFFLYQQMQQLMETGVERDRLVFFSFEDERLADVTLDDLHWIEDEYFARFPENRSQRVTFFLDEVQLVEGWERYVRRLMDTENIQVFFSGSSAKLLSREVASAMRGRAMETVIYPYSFREYLTCHNTEIPGRPDRAGKALRSLLENRVSSYLVEGGFPEAQGLETRERNALLQGYVNTLIFRDVVERHDAANLAVLRLLVRHLISNFGSPFTVNKFYNHLKSQGVQVGKGTLHDYLGHLQDAFLIYPVAIYTESERKRMVNPIKPYVVDSGLARSYSLKREPDTGNLLENAVLIELLRRGAEVTYFRTPSGLEVDFIAQHPDGRIEAAQVSADISQPQTREREERAVTELGELLPDAEFILVNLSEESERKVGGTTLRVIPAWKWLLTP